MDKIIFTCKTITPLVMNGAYGNFPELRPPVIKASLRFWWRALHGHMFLDQLREQEGKIFGNTKGRSKVLIRVVEDIGSETIKQSILPHEKDGFNPSAFPTKKTFKIRLDCESSQTEMLKNLFILACTLGGWGKRSRRGFGSVEVTEIDGAAYSMPKTIDEIYALLPKAYFEKANNTIYSNFNRNEPYPYLKSIEIGVEFSSESELLKSIGNASSDVKRDNADSWDYRNSIGHVSKRFASPVYVTIIESNGKFKPITSTLNIALENNKQKPQNASSIQSDFKSKILNP